MSLVHVAVGVVRNSFGQILIARRASHQHQGGLWEFPGGKIELGETPRAALERELKEEVGIDVLATSALTKVEHHYNDKSVLLDVHYVTAFAGEASGREGQPVCWVPPDRLREYQFPAANIPILHAIALPSHMAITGDPESTEAFAAALGRAVAKGAGIVQVRFKSLPSSLWHSYIAATKLQYPDLLITVNSSIGEDSWAGMPGLHLTSCDLLAQASRPIPPSILLGASCHNRAEVEHARRISVDYVTISPILATATHPEAEPLGWEAFSDLAHLAHCPAFALGGLVVDDTKCARKFGAHGIAAISHFWR